MFTVPGIRTQVLTLLRQVPYWLGCPWHTLATWSLFYTLENPDTDKWEIGSRLYVVKQELEHRSSNLKALPITGVSSLIDKALKKAAHIGKPIASILCCTVFKALLFKSMLKESGLSSGAPSPRQPLLLPDPHCPPRWWRVNHQSECAHWSLRMTQEHRGTKGGVANCRTKPGSHLWPR